MKRMQLSVSTLMALIASLFIGLVIGRYQGHLDRQPPPAQRAAGYLHMGQSLLQEGRIPEALSYFEKSISTDPNSFEGFRGLGDIAYREHRYADAHSQLSRAIQAALDSHLQGQALRYLFQRRAVMSLALSKERRDQSLVDCQAALQDVWDAYRAGAGPDPYFTQLINETYKDCQAEMKRLKTGHE